VKQFKQGITELTLLPSDGGRFEQIYSKLSTGQFPDNATIASEVQQRL